MSMVDRTSIGFAQASNPLPWKQAPAIFYAEEPFKHVKPLDRLWRRLQALYFSHTSALRLKGLSPVIRAAAGYEKTVAGLDDQALQARGRELAMQLKKNERNYDLEGKVFAVIREASRRVLGMRHHDVQLLGGCALLRGQIAEMNTGEGKSLTGTLASIAMALAGVPVHVVTVNDYLANRDAEEMEPLFAFFGLTVGVIKEGLEPEARKAAYRCDITYTSNSQIAFDYLRDRLLLSKTGGNLSRKVRFSDGDQLIMRGLHFVIVDEADSVLIDEARTPLILSSQGENAVRKDVYMNAYRLAKDLTNGRDFHVHDQTRRVEILDGGYAAIGQAGEGAEGIWAMRQLREDLVNKALQAIHLMGRNDHYVVQDGKVVIVDEYTGRIMKDRFWSDGLQQMVELKEGVDLSDERSTLGRITYQRFFGRYKRFSGMSGTVSELASELWEVYRLKIVKIPTHKTKRLKVMPGHVSETLATKWVRVANVARLLSQKGIPVLIGTRSVEMSQQASDHLHRAGIEHSVLNAENLELEADLVGKAGLAGRVTVATNIAGRGTDIKLGEGVEECGGLAVVLSEYHDSQRIDRQLAGRAARQGDPGIFVPVTSLEDEIFVRHAPFWVRLLVGTFAKGHRSKVAFWGMRQAQKRAEAKNAKIRRQLLKADGQLERNMSFSGVFE